MSPPALLVSIHDISARTLEPCRRAAELLAELGVPARALTLLVIPAHAGEPLLPGSDTASWVAGMAADGATVVMHGLTHVMERPVLAPWRWPAAYVWARRQGELYATGAAETARRLQEGRRLLQEAGLAGAVSGFVPPAWLMSRGARRAVLGAGFRWHEDVSGIRLDGRRLARRLIGWGSLTAAEAVLTSWYARLQARRRPADTRLAVHPVDIQRERTRRCLVSVVQSLLPRMRPLSYQAYLDELNPGRG